MPENNEQRLRKAKTSFLLKNNYTGDFRIMVAWGIYPDLFQWNSKELNTYIRKNNAQAAHKHVWERCVYHNIWRWAIHARDREVGREKETKPGTAKGSPSLDLLAGWGGGEYNEVVSWLFEALNCPA